MKIVFESKKFLSCFKVTLFENQLQLNNNLHGINFQFELPYPYLQHP